MKGTIRIIASILLVITLAFTVGCVPSGADISLEGLTLGTVTMDGKPVAGLPSQKINLLLQVSAQKVTIKYSADGTIVILSPSGATIEIKAGSILIKGTKPEQIKVEWATGQ